MSTVATKYKTSIKKPISFSPLRKLQYYYHHRKEIISSIRSTNYILSVTLAISQMSTVAPKYKTSIKKPISFSPLRKLQYYYHHRKGLISSIRSTNYILSVTLAISWISIFTTKYKTSIKKPISFSPLRKLQYYYHHRKGLISSIRSTNYILSVTLAISWISIFTTKYKTSIKKPISFSPLRKLQYYYHHRKGIISSIRSTKYILSVTLAISQISTFATKYKTSIKKQNHPLRYVSYSITI